MPGATVVLISESRGTKSVAAVTNETGDYVLPNITPDTYTVEISMQGFKTLKRTGVSVSGGDRVAVGGLVIEVGGASETVDVTAEAPLIQASSGERSFTVTTESVENLPLSNRNFASLTQLTPGVTGTTTRLGGGGQNNIMMDGVSTMDTGNNGQMLQMNVEAIAEVKVLTSGYQAEYGRSSGLQITAVTKSGTNRLRGSLYDVERNSDWNENSWVNVRERPAEDHSERARLGLLAERTGGQAGRQQQAVLLLQPRVPAAGEWPAGQPVPCADAAPSAPVDFSQSTDQNGNPIPNLCRFQPVPTAASFRGKVIPADRAVSAGHGDPQALARNRTRTGLNYNYEVELPTVNTLIQQPAVRARLSAAFGWRITGKYAGQMRSHEVNSIGGAAAPGTTARIPGFNDYVEPYPWIGTISVTNNLTLNSTTFLEATYGWVQNQLGSMIITPVSNRFNAGLGDLPLLFPDAGRDRFALLRDQAARSVGDAVLPGRTGPAAADLCVGQPCGERAAEPGLPRVHEHQPHAGFLDQPDEGRGNATPSRPASTSITATRRRTSAPAAARRSRATSASPTTRRTRSTPASASPMPRSACSPATSSSRSSSKAASSTTRWTGTSRTTGRSTPS